MKPELKPCPFCGGEASFDHDDNGWNWIYCKSCDASTDARVSAMDDCRPLLAEAWNRRTPAGLEQACTHKWGVEWNTHNHEPARTVCIKCGYKPDTHALNTACEPVKVPSDEDINAAWHELTGRACLPGSIAHASARALLAKYSEQPSKCSEVAGHTAEGMASQGAQGFRDGYAAALDEAIAQCNALNNDENSERYRAGASWCAERIKALKSGRQQT